MTVAELIEQLKDSPTDTRVFIWLSGNRYPITDIHIDLGDNYIDLNAKLPWGEAA